jgi:hypothetical protein
MKNLTQKIFKKLIIIILIGFLNNFQVSGVNNKKGNYKLNELKQKVLEEYKRIEDLINKKYYNENIIMTNAFNSIRNSKEIIIETFNDIKQINEELIKFFKYPKTYETLYNKVSYNKYKNKVKNIEVRKYLSLYILIKL